MDITETLNEGLKRGYQVTVTAAELDEKVNQKLKEARPEIEMRGFRKGKVPMALLKKQFGPRVLGEAMQESIDDVLKAHFEKTGDRPVAQPEVKMTNENWKEGDDITVDVSYECLPAMPEVDFSSVALERMVVEPSDEDVKSSLENLAQSAQDFADREEGSAAEDGDQVTIDFAGSVDGEAFEGGTAEDYPLVLGSGSFIPGFEEQLVGKAVGDEVDVNVTFPEEYGAEHLAGKSAVFSCKIKAVKAPQAAEITDELAQKFGYDTVAALEEDIAKRLADEYKGAARTLMKRQLMDALDGMVSIDLPQSLTDGEAKQIAHQLWHEENPEHQGHDHGEIEPTEEHLSLANRRVKLGLLLAETGQKNEIAVSDNELTQAVIQQARQYPGQEQQFFEFVQKNRQALEQIRAPLFEDKVIDYIFELAKIEDKPVSKEALKEALDALDDE